MVIIQKSKTLEQRFEKLLQLGHQSLLCSGQGFANYISTRYLPPVWIYNVVEESEGEEEKH